jgi:DNA polymerase-3 subunit beta
VAVNESFSASFALPQRQLKHLFQMVHFAMAQQDIRYYLNGLLLVTDQDAVRVIATDGHRLAYCHTEVPGAALARNEVIIPRKTVLELQRLLGDTDEPVQIDVAANQVRLRFGDVEMLSKLVEGKFPDYQRVIPNGYRKRAVIRRDTLAASLARASILTSDKFRGVRLALSNGSMRIQTSNAEQEEAIEEIEIDYSGDTLELGFNVGYLQDVLGNLKTEEVAIDFGDPNSSALLTVPGDDTFKYVVMPMRI